jgi:hypothetical protein
MYERTYRSTVLKKEVPPVPAPTGIRWKRILLCAISLIVIGGVIFLIRASWLQVRSVSTTGTDVADPEEISQFVESKLEGRVLYIFPKTSTVIISTHALESELKQAFPRLETVTIHRDSMHSLAVRVNEYDRKYLWCTDSTCYFMDEKGTVFAEAPYFSGNAYPKIMIGELAPLPFKPITTEQLEFVETIKSRLEAISLTPTVFQFVSAHELAVSFIHRDTEAKILFDPTRDLESSLQALFTGMRAPAFALEYASKQLEYIDLRFSNKMVYKFK